jgi:hypothetical protein
MRLVLEQLRPAAQLVTAGAGQVADRPTFLAEGTRQEEGQPLDAQRLGRRRQRDAVPAEQAGDLQVARFPADGDEDEIVLDQRVDRFAPSRPSPPALSHPEGAG